MQAERCLCALMHLQHHHAIQLQSLTKPPVKFGSGVLRRHAQTCQSSVDKLCELGPVHSSAARNNRVPTYDLAITGAKWQCGWLVKNIRVHKPHQLTTKCIQRQRINGSASDALVQAAGPLVCHADALTLVINGLTPSPIRDTSTASN